MTDLYLVHLLKLIVTVKEKASKKHDYMFLIFYFVVAVKTTSNLKRQLYEGLAYFLQPPN